MNSEYSVFFFLEFLYRKNEETLKVVQVCYANLSKCSPSVHFSKSSYYFSNSNEDVQKVVKKIMIFIFEVVFSFISLVMSFPHDFLPNIVVVARSNEACRGETAVTR